MIDPITLSKKMENLVSRENAKKYYRFRKTRFYGGCATADCLGCNLRCVYCWAQKKVWKRIIGKALLTKREAFVIMGFFRKLK